jgi:hypothetical protein
LCEEARKSAPFRRKLVPQVTVEEDIERHVIPVERARALQCNADLRKKILRRRELPVAQRPALTASVHCGAPRFLDQRERRLRAAMDEFRAELERHR